MGAEFNHTIVWCRDKQRSTRFLTEILDLPDAIPCGPMLVVELDNNASLDFHEKEGEIASQHYAFLIEEASFEAVFERIKQRVETYWADPDKRRPGEVNRRDDGYGVYFDDPDGHFLEVITRPYGGG